jgi:ABC-type branched-subunit amino acid transport system ATPase component
MTPLLEVREARVLFGGVRALDGASLTVSEGELCGLIGPNGSGKSTLLGAISRLTGLTEGELVLDGTEYTHHPPHLAAELGIARTFQTVRLLGEMTVLANVMIGAGAQAVRHRPIVNWLHLPRIARDERGARAAAEEALERVGMHGHRHSHPQDLPYGMQRRVEVARALAARPRLLLLDEPTAGMSQGERTELGDVLVELHRDGLTQILVEHDLGMIHRVCSTAYALNFGKVIASGTPREVADDALVREAYLGRGAADDRRPEDASVEAPG